MHELSIAMELQRGLRAEIEGLGGGRLLAVSVALGELSAIEPDLLRFAWEAVTAQGPDQGAELELTWHAVTQRCPACGVIEERASGSWMRLCPTCDAPLSLEGGRELDITSFAYDESVPSICDSTRAARPTEYSQ